MIKGRKDQWLTIEHVCHAVQSPISFEVHCHIYTPVIYISSQIYFAAVNKIIHHLKLIHCVSQATGDIITHGLTRILISQ